MWISVQAIVISLLIANLLSLIINTYPNKKILGYGILEQMKDLLPALLLSGIMFGVTYFIYYMDGAGFMTLVKQVLIGVVVYFTLAALFKVEPFVYIVNFFKNLSLKKKK